MRRAIFGRAEHVGQLTDEARAEQVGEATFDPGEHHLAGDTTRSHGGRHEHAGIEHDEHYDVATQSSSRS